MAVRNRLALAATVLAGLVLVAVGGLGLVVPDVLHEANGIPPADHPAMRNEVRGVGAALAAVGGLVLVGVRRAAWRSQAALLAATVLLAFALGRAVSWLADGAPGPGLVTAGAVELVLGTAAAWSAREARLGAHAPDRVSSPAR
ncbi:DUF4345 domain-containing protein [Actinotalea sp. K2]|uniref:DUF4345 domain-containing protein n=1 Tax=Actinotalea sp. K2 TaxID=2939438 RepID=UPI00201832EA|nr:DUF4345 domain-containing protein [Actinotalea sp. K2]MCL3859714.1 DUF4345 domain-containing protein [Actinotalea sp. K2]